MIEFSQPAQCLFCPQRRKIALLLKLVMAASAAIIMALILFSQEQNAPSRPKMQSHRKAPGKRALRESRFLQQNSHEVREHSPVILSPRGAVKFVLRLGSVFWKFSPRSSLSSLKNLRLWRRCISFLTRGAGRY